MGKSWSRLLWELDDIFTKTQSSLGQPSVFIQISSNHTRFIWNTNHYVCRAELKPHCFKRFHQWNIFFYYLMKKCCFFFIYIECFAFVNFGGWNFRFFFHNLYSHSLLPGGESLRRYWSRSWRWRGKKGSEVSIFHMNKIAFITTINQITFIFPCSGFSSNLKWKRIVMQFDISMNVATEDLHSHFTIWYVIVVPEEYHNEIQYQCKCIILNTQTVLQ